MSTIVYQAPIYSRDVSYTNFKGETKDVRLDFSLSPLKLLSLIASFDIKPVKSGNPARNGQPGNITEEQQLTFMRDIALAAAGVASEDGESWEEFEGFEKTLPAQAFLAKLAASDGDRREFAEKVILEPFRTFAHYAKADESNSPQDVQKLDQMLSQIENIFKFEEKKETVEERRARLEAELNLLGQTEDQ